VNRLAAIDALRGVVMIIMALDHVRDFFHRGAMTGSPTNLATTTPLLFLTRWMTHICAPVFMFAAGLGAYFYWRNHGHSKTQLSWFLVTRGGWLIVLELTVMQLAYNFDVSSRYPIFLLVLWALGACMIVLALLVWLPIPLLAAVSTLTIVLHHLVDGIDARTLGDYSAWWNLLHQIGAFPFAGRIFVAAYPLVPWFAVMALGFCFGPLFEKPFALRQRVLLVAGLAATVTFVVVRSVNLYGDPSPWSVQPSAIVTTLSFLNTTKYPPSLSFVLMTLGPALLVLAWFERLPLSRANPLIVFGRVPLFYFVLHFHLAHALAVVVAAAVYGDTAWSFMLQPVPSMGGPAASFPADFGYSLWVTYVMWIVVVAALYPVCRWYANVKARSRSRWLAYL
jgi:uncharacterized membrane protein